MPQWPQNNSKTRGFLPPEDIEPKSDGYEKENSLYHYRDWRGHILDIKNNGVGKTKDKFNESNNKTNNANDYSTRDYYIKFKDRATDYFKHTLQVVDELNQDFPTTVDSTNRLDQFKNTPFENQDPPIYGFEIIFDDVSSPLLNGSIKDFLLNYSNIDEVAARIPVYEDFKQQFQKIFKTKTFLRIDDSQTKITNMHNTDRSLYPYSGTRNVAGTHKDAYLVHYLKKIGGLGNLIEKNTPDSSKSFVEYNKDLISLTFREDVSTTIGTLAHLYKLLYWSRPQGKGIIPDNLLRFNCDIIVSEIRNFNRVRKEKNNLQVVKDNLSRYRYTIYEGQFYFNKMPHEEEIDITKGSSIYDDYQISFDYKYSTMKHERFVPDTERNWGKYVGYDSGAMWKIKPNSQSTNQNNPGEIWNDNSVPRFLTVDKTNPDILEIPSDNNYERSEADPDNTLDVLKENTEKRLARNQIIPNEKNYEENRQEISIRKILLNEALEKARGWITRKTGYAELGNVYHPNYTLHQSFFDIRNEIENFLKGGNRNSSGGGDSVYSPRS